MQSSSDLVSGKVDIQLMADTIARQSMPGDFWILPEVFDTGWNVGAQSPEIDGARCRSFFQLMAKKYGISICGSFYERTADGRFSNTFAIVSADGEKIQTCAKRHMFGDFEKGFVKPGESMLSFTVDGVRFRAVVCYDLRFPVWCRNTKSDTYDALVCVSQWPLQRSADKHLLLAARAMENVAFAINANGLGDSAVYLPDGKKDFALEAGVHVGWYQLDINILHEMRRRRKYLLDADDFELKL